MTRPRLALGLVACTFLASAALADVPTGIEAIDLDALDYRKSPVFAGVTVAFVTGDPGKPGLYTTHATMAADSRVAPHTHPDPRLTVVTEGTMYVGVGETFDEEKLFAFPAGSVFITHAGVPHFMWAKDGATSVLDSGAGPSGAAFLDD